MRDLTESLLELVRRTSTDLSPDVEGALKAAREREAPGSAAQGTLDTILQNVAMAREMSSPICQDTGTPMFYVRYPAGWTTEPAGATGSERTSTAGSVARALREQIRAAIAQATKKSYLRPNAVDAITDKNSGNNLGGEDFPVIHFEEVEGDELTVDLMLKGGGSENCGAQYSLPYGPLSAGRDLGGVRRVVLDAVQKAQGTGCAPGVIGVAIGGDRGASYAASKEMFLRKLDDRNPDEKLAALEERLCAECNQLGIGPMGFGGDTTVLGVKMTGLHRLPASFFVSVSYMCWAHRRRRMTVRGDQVIYE